MSFGSIFVIMNLSEISLLKFLLYQHPTKQVHRSNLSKITHWNKIYLCRLTKVFQQNIVTVVYIK